MAKLLRLDVAQLTDVGRKREHNEDNMAYVIPKDPQVMAHKGALLIVADGMGGHAAGEVASEIAVDTVSNAYYQDENNDVSISLLRAIQRANAAIHQRAAENMLRSGMGTTCVAMVLRGNMAYIANVGDSRAYLIRKAQIRQVSQDHSWVAEQVRAGLLTEEQARTHAQRNVITRSLGTKPEEDIDIFREVLEEGDTLILCTDGLSGLVGDEELLRTVDQFVPQESVYHLVERANDYGGSDNITAIVARVQEVGVEPPGVRQPVPIGGPELSNEDTARLFAQQGAGINMLTHNGEAPVPGSPFTFVSSGPLASPDHDTAPQPTLKTRRPHSRLFAPTLVMLALLILVAGGSGFYYFMHTNQSQTIAQTLTSASHLINQASTEIKNHPDQALQNLANAQQQLRNLQKNYTLNASDASQLANLQTQLVSETKTAILLYNQSAHITALPCTSTSARPDSVNPGTSGTQAQTVVSIQSSSGTAYYALGQDDKIYQLIQSSGSNGSNPYNLSTPLALNPANTQITSIVGAQSKIFALSQLVTDTIPGNYAINLFNPGPHAILQRARAQNIDLSLAAKGQVPGLITAWNNGNNTFEVYVVLQSISNLNNVTILTYHVDNKGNFSAAKPTLISVSEPISSIAATADQLFLLMADGEMLSLPISNQTLANVPIPVLIGAPIAPPLATGFQNFTANTSVPTITSVPQEGSIPLKVSGPSNSPQAILKAGMVTGTNGTLQVHLFIGDQANHRVLDLTTEPPQPVATAHGPGSTPTATASPTTNVQSSLTLYLGQQYVSPDYFNTIKSVAIDPSNTAIYILGQNTQNSESLAVVSTQNACPSSTQQNGN